MRWKTLFAGTTALVLVGCSFAYAQKPTTDDKAAPQSDKTAPGQSSTRKLPLEERAAIMDARIAVHKAALKLTPDQEQKWPAYEAALRNLAKLRVEAAPGTEIAEPRRPLASARGGFEHRQHGVETVGRRGGAAVQ